MLKNLDCSSLLGFKGDAGARRLIELLNEELRQTCAQPADRGYRRALYENPNLCAGLNAPAAEVLKYKFVNPMEAIRA